MLPEVSMERREVRLEDGRYLIYYSFPPSKTKGAPPPREEKPAEPEVKRV
jgi:hypothetical protein